MSPGSKPSTSQATWMEREASEIPFVVAQQRDGISADLQQIVAAIEDFDPDGVVICGRGSSLNAGVYGKYLFETCLGWPVSFCAPSVTTLYDQKLVFERKLFIAISQSGQSSDLIAASQAARKSGAMLIVLVNDVSSPLAGLPGQILPMGAGKERSVAATKTFVASLSALSDLIARLARDKGLEDAIHSLPTYLDACLATCNGLDLGHFRETPHAYSLARGLGYPIAREAALKLKETAGICAEAYSLAEFMHGPITTVDEASHLLAFIQADAAFDSAKQALREITKLRPQLTVLSSQALGSIETVNFPNAPHPLLEPIGFVTGFYPMAANLASLRGRSPDAPRNISKVTLTI